MTAVNGVRVVNPYEAEISTILSCTLPWAPGEYRGERLRVNGQAAQVEPFGAPWLDGSHRFTRVSFLAYLDPATPGVPWQEVCDVVHDSCVSARGFRWHPLAVSKMPETRLALGVGDDVALLPPVRLTYGGTTTVRGRVWCRVENSPVWADLIVEALTDQPFARFWLWYGASDPRVRGMTFDLGKITLAVSEGVGLHVHHSDVKCESVPDAGQVVLDNGGRWAEGQSQAIAGVLVFDPAWWNAAAAAETAVPPRAVSTEWAASGAYAPFGVVPPLPDIGVAEITAIQVSDFRGRGKGPWAPPSWGSAPKHNATGETGGMGHTHAPLELNGWPLGVFTHEWNARQEACRMAWFREADGSPVRAADHPDAYFWSGSPFRTSPDQLGKDASEWANPRESTNGQVWTHTDRQHLARAAFCTTAMMTGDPGLLAMCDAVTDAQLLDTRVDTSHPTVNSPGTGRAIGRQLRFCSRLWVITGRADIHRRLSERIGAMFDHWDGRHAMPYKPLDVRPPDPRNIGGKFHWVACWEEALAIVGLFAAWKETGDARAAHMITEAADALLRLGLDPTSPTPVALKAHAVDPADAQPLAQVPGQPDVFERYDPFGDYMVPAFRAARTVLDATAEQGYDGRFDRVIQHYAEQPGDVDVVLRRARWHSV